MDHANTRSDTHPSRLGASCAATIAGIVTLLCAATVHADVVTVTNSSKDKNKVLSDFHSFSKTKNQGDKSTQKKKGDATDDDTIAPGGKKNITVPDGTKSVTISWLDAAGKEVESDFDLPQGNTIQLAAFFGPGFDQDAFAVAFDIGLGAVPEEGTLWQVLNGKITDPAYGWITFYDTSMTGGFIQRDGDGNPLNPLLSGGTMVADFPFEIDVIPSPGSALMLAASVGVIARRRR